MSKIYLVLLSFFVIAAFPVTTNAQDVTTQTTAPRAQAPIKPNSARSEIKNTAMEARDAMQTKISEARMEFQEKVKEVSDTKKQQILENIVNRINENNQTRTQQMSERLDRLTLVIVNISKMAATLKDKGIDVSKLNSLITAATAAVEAAKTSVTEQMEKEYVVNITTDAALKTNTRSIIQAYIADIKAVHQKVVAAHKAIVQAHTTAKSLSNDTMEDDDPTVVE